MALVLKDRVKETTTTTGTGAVTLLGASTGFQAFSVIGNSNTTYYCIAGQTSSEWEVGLGTYTLSGTTLSRDTVLASSNSGSLVNFSAGTKDVFGVYPAGKAVYADASNIVALTNPTITNYTETLYSANTGSAITISLTNGTVQKLTLNSASVTITLPTAAAGKSFLLMLAQDGTGGRAVTWATPTWPSATAPTITTTASKMDIYSFFSDGTNWYGVTVAQNYSV